LSPGTGQALLGWKYLPWNGVSNWYYFDGDCKMTTGWQNIDGYWYYLGSDGKMVTGWKSIGGKWYYFRTATNTPAKGSLGAMLAGGSWKIGSKTYNFNSSGHCTNP
jgi:glucan-binding YG repeat protein